MTDRQIGRQPKRKGGTWRSPTNIIQNDGVTDTSSLSHSHTNSFLFIFFFCLSRNILCHQLSLQPPPLLSLYIYVQPSKHLCTTLSSSLLTTSLPFNTPLFLLLSYADRQWLNLASPRPPLCWRTPPSRSRHSPPPPPHRRRRRLLMPELHSRCRSPAPPSPRRSCSPPPRL